MELGHAMAAQENEAARIQSPVKVVREQGGVDVQHSGLELESPRQASERVVGLRQEQDTKTEHGVEVEAEVGVEVGVREEGVQRGRGLQEEAAAEQEPESMSSMFARMMDTARKSSVANIAAANAVLDTNTALSPSPQQHTGNVALPEGDTPSEASTSSSESDRSVDDDEDAQNYRGERGGSETRQVARAPDSSVAVDSITSAAARADGNEQVKEDAQIERVRRLSSSESGGWGAESSGANSDTEESELSGTSDDSEEERDTRGALPVSDADSGDRTRRERHAPSDIDDQNGVDRDNSVSVLASSREDTSPTTPPVDGVNDEVMKFGEGGNLSEESVESGDSVSMASAAVVAPEGDSLKGDNEPQSPDGRLAGSAGLSLATVGDNTAERKPQLDEPNPHGEEEKTATPRSGSDLPASNAKHHDDHGGSEQFPADHDVMEGWESHLDEETGRMYYYHEKTGVTSWDHPRGDTREVEQTPTTHTANEGAAVDTEDDARGASLVEAAAQGPALVAAGAATEVQPLEAEWAAGGNGGDARQQASLETRDDSDARGINHTGEAGETAEVVEDAAARGNDQSKAAADVESFLGNEGDDGRLGEEEEVQHTSAAAADGGVEAGKGEVQWEEIVDPATGHKYFYNPMTRQSAWALPEGVLATAAANAAAAVAAAEAAAAASAAATVEGE